MERFLQMCNRVSSNTRINLDTTRDFNIPPEYLEKCRIVLTQVKNKINRADTIHIGFIQREFDNLTELGEKLKEVTTDGEIDEGVLLYFSYNLFKDHINNLTNEQQNIIKVLACYSML